MDLESRKIFIDTQSFIKLGLNFNHASLQSLLTLCKEKRVENITTSIVKREVDRKIHASIVEGLSSLKSFQRKARLLENIDDEKISNLFADIDSEDIAAKSLKVFEDYLRESNTIFAPINAVNPDLIFDAYFSGVAPFDGGKKKSEFPDAFSLEAIQALLGDDKAYVISGDGDLKSYCESSDNLIILDALERFLDIFNSHESFVYEAIKSHIKENTAEIKRKILEQFDDSFAYNEAPWEDSEVEYFQALEVYDIDPLIVLVDDKRCLVTIDVDVDYEYTVTGPDFVNGTYDREEGRMYTFGTTSHTNATTETFTIELVYEYEIDDGEIINIEETDLSVYGISNGVALHVEEHGNDYY
jgi:hypothetical protein